MDKLLPCPCCNGAAESDSNQGFRTYIEGRLSNRLVVYCLGCGLEVGICKADEPYATIEDAISIWNRRAQPVKQEQEPVLWQWRRKKDAPFWELKHTSSVELFATTDDSEVRRLYEHPPADAQQQEIERLKADKQRLMDTQAKCLEETWKLQSQLTEYKADAERYRRTRILGAAINECTPLLRFTNLDVFIDRDIKVNPSRGEFKDAAIAKVKP